MIKPFKKRLISCQNPDILGDIGQLVIAFNEIAKKLDEIIDEVNKLKEVKEND